MTVEVASKAGRYVFLVFFLAIIIGILVFSYKNNNSPENKNSPLRRDSRDAPLYEKILGISIVASLVLGVIAFILLENWIIGTICISYFVLVVIGFAIFGGVNKVTIKTVMYGTTTTIHYTKEEFEARLLEGTLDLTNCIVKYPRGYKPPKVGFDDYDSQDDPFAKYD